VSQGITPGDVLGGVFSKKQRAWTSGPKRSENPDRGAFTRARILVQLTRVK
jgi:hypothetical protein